MNRNSELVNQRYDALMFAPSPQAARRAARELIRIVLGDAGLDLPLDEGLRQVCRQLRPAEDPVDQARFESEFIELGIWPNASRSIAA
jgi:hypothetical protein